MGLSTDPAKRARQLAGLGKSNTVLAERLAAGHDYDAASPAPTPAPLDVPPVTPSKPAELVGGQPIRDFQEQPDYARPATTEPDDAGAEPGANLAASAAGEPKPEPEPEPRRRGGGFLDGLKYGR